MKKYERIGMSCLILAVGSLALGLFVAPWCLALGAALAGASVALEVAADEIGSHTIQTIQIICADTTAEEQWYDEQQYDFMLKQEVN